MPKTIEARWENWDGQGRQHVLLKETGGRFLAEGSILVSGNAAFTAEFKIECDAAWRVRRAEIALTGGQRLQLIADGEGNWFDGAGRSLADVHDAIDIDLSASPFTNTLPIRRCDLAIGESVDITAAYVTFPELSLAADPQRYTRLDQRRYRYASRDSDFTRDIEVDADGLVVNYPGLFRRIQ
jgi:hypothetical protein